MNDAPEPVHKGEPNELHIGYTDSSGQPELHIYGSDEDGWSVWLNTGTADHDGLCIGTGDTRQAAVTEAVRIAEWIERTLQAPPQ